MGIYLWTRVVSRRLRGKCQISSYRIIWFPDMADNCTNIVIVFLWKNLVIIFSLQRNDHVDSHNISFCDCTRMVLFEDTIGLYTSIYHDTVFSVLNVGALSAAISPRTYSSNTAPS